MSIMVDQWWMKQFAQIQKVKGIFAGHRSRFFWLVAAAAGLFALSNGTLMAQEQTRSFPIRHGSGPFDITQGPDGNFWFTLSNSSKVARITPRGQISYIRTPSPSNPAFITLGPDTNLWFGEGSTGRIASVTPAGVVTEFQFSFFAVSGGSTTGAAGKIWFRDQTDHEIG